MDGLKIDLSSPKNKHATGRSNYNICMYVCIYIYIYIHTHEYIYIYIYMRYICIVILPLAGLAWGSTQTGASEQGRKKR